MTDYFSELENHLGRVTARGIHNRRSVSRPASAGALAAIASVVLVLAVVAVALSTGGSHRARPRTATRPPAQSVSQRPHGAYCVNAITHTRMVCLPQRTESAPSRDGFPALPVPAGAPTRRIAQLHLHAPSGAKQPTATARVIKQGGTYFVAIVGAALRANTRRDAYAVWLANGARKPKLLGFVAIPAVKPNGTLKAVGMLPKAPFRYHELLITIETKTHPRAPGTIVLEGSFHR